MTAYLALMAGKRPATPEPARSAAASRTPSQHSSFAVEHGAAASSPKAARADTASDFSFGESSVVEELSFKSAGSSVRW